MDGELIPKIEREPAEPRPVEATAERPAVSVQEAAAASGPERAERAIPKIEVRPTAVLPDQRQAVLERILEDGLRDTYFAMPVTVRSSFRSAGEALARRLRALSDLGKAARPNAVYRLIIIWLASIPAVNRFFKMQAAKIKTDRLLDEISPPAENP